MNTITHKKSMPDRLEAKYFEFTVQILSPPPTFHPVYALENPIYFTVCRAF